MAIVAIMVKNPAQIGPQRTQSLQGMLAWCATGVLGVMPGVARGTTGRSADEYSLRNS
jgi:hypothetical protein